MRLHLIRPPLPYLAQPNSYGPLGLGYLAAYVRREMPDVTVEICDMACGDELREADVFGWTSTSLDYNTVVSLAHDTRRKYPSAKHIIGGSHASVFGEECDGIFDAVFVGEAEKSLVRWLKWFKSGDTVAPDRLRRAEAVFDLDILPFPERKRPEDKQLVHGSAHSITMMASRGCPFDCSFCGSKSMWGRKIRWRSPENVVKEAEYVIKEFGVTDIAMIDDTLTVNRKWLDRFCQLMAPLKVHWRALSRVDLKDANYVFDMMKNSGCTEVCFGVESFDKNVLAMLDKRTDPEQAQKAILNAHYSGLSTRVFMMISTPGETLDTPYTNIRHMDRVAHAMDLVSLSTFMPLPGTDIYNDPAKYGIEIVDKDLSHHNRYQWGPNGENKIYSPIRINGLSHEDQLENIRRMRKYVGSLQSANRGIPT